MSTKNSVVPVCLVAAFLLACENSFLVAQIPEDPCEFHKALFDDPDLDSFLEEEHFDLDGKTRAFTPQDTANILVTINAIPLLLQNFYLRTNPPCMRSLLDYPTFLPMHKLMCGWTVGGTLFWNQTGKMFLKPGPLDSDCSNECPTSVSCYLGVCNQNLLNAIDNSIQAAKDTFGVKLDINAKQIFPLLSAIYFQERRLGAMFHAQYVWGRRKMRVQAMAPLYYGERNYFLDAKDQETLQNSMKGASEAQPSEQAQMDFAMAHLLCDVVGLGDTRVYYDFEPYCGEKIISRLGLLVTIPTAFAMRRGVMGSRFNLFEQRPILDMTELANLGVSDSAADQQLAATQAQSFMFGALDCLSSNLINMPLGRKKHWGLGALMDTEYPLYPFIPRPWATHIRLKSFISLEYVLPRTEQRYFIQTQESKEAAFATHDLLRPQSQILDQINADPVYATEVLEFLQEQATQMFYPFLYGDSKHAKQLLPCNVKVMPGIVFRWTSRALYEGESFGFFLGLDTWIAGQEKLVAKNLPCCLDFARAVTPLGYQWQGFGAVYFKIPRPNNLWTIGLHFTDTLYSSGIGSDFTVALNLETTF